MYQKFNKILIIKLIKLLKNKIKSQKIIIKLKRLLKKKDTEILNKI